MKSLTRDNPHYQGSKSHQIEHTPFLQLIAQSDLSIFISDQVREFLVLCRSANTRKAYSRDLKRFERWGGCLPCAPETLAVYFAEHARTHAPITLRRWAASLSRAHLAAGFPDPTRIEPFVSTLAGIVRSFGQPPTGAKPLLREQLFAALDAMESCSLSKRDRALLLIGFGGGFRRSELVGLDISDVSLVRRGLLITIRRSKTDQQGEGRQLAIPFGNTRHCPVQAFEGWVEALSVSSGPLFRAVNRHGHISGARLSGEAVSAVVKRRLAATGIDPGQYSGHSLRAGFITSAAEMGVSTWKIRQQTGHQSDLMVSRYVRPVELFEGNAVGFLL